LEAPWGVVLAGGPGRRLGGDKPLRRLAGRRFLDWVASALQQVCPRVVVSAAHQHLDPAPAWPVVADRWPGQGPLNALASTLMATQAPALLAVAVDLPLVRPKLLEMLAQGPEDDLARAPVGPQGWPEPLLAYYHRGVLPEALRLLEQGERRTRILLQRVGARLIPAREVAQADPDGVSFVNINYPEDLARAERIVGHSGLFDTA